MPWTPKKTIKAIVESGNHYLAAVRGHSRSVPLRSNGQMRKHRGNQPKLYQTVQKQFIAQETFSKVNKGTRNFVSPVVFDDDLPHSRLWRIEKRKVSTMKSDFSFLGWLNVQTIIKVESQRQTRHKIESQTRYYISDLKETALSFYQRIWGYWGVENKVHYVRDVTFKEDKSRVSILPLPQILALARNLAINLYRNAGFDMRSGVPLGQHGSSTSPMSIWFRPCSISALVSA